MLNKNSERTKRWIKLHPEKASAAQQKHSAIKKINRDEALYYIKKAEHKTPMRAIKAFCRACEYGESRSGKNYLNAPVICKKKRCPLFCFRNGNPLCMKRGLKRDIVAMRAAKEAQYA